jgi:hypothetical protein
MVQRLNTDTTTMLKNDTEPRIVRSVGTPPHRHPLENYSSHTAPPEPRSKSRTAKLGKHDTACFLSRSAKNMRKNLMIQRCRLRLKNSSPRLSGTRRLSPQRFAGFGNIQKSRSKNWQMRHSHHTLIVIELLKGRTGTQRGRRTHWSTTENPVKVNN